LIQQTFSQNNPQQISFSWFHLKILVDLGYNSRDINIRYSVRIRQPLNKVDQRPHDTQGRTGSHDLITT
jgi:hypothetical protein